MNPEEKINSLSHELFVAREKLQKTEMELSNLRIAYRSIQAKLGESQKHLAIANNVANTAVAFDAMDHDDWGYGTRILFHQGKWYIKRSPFYLNKQNEWIKKESYRSYEDFELNGFESPAEALEHFNKHRKEKKA